MESSVCSPGGASVHPNSISIGSAIFTQLTADSRYTSQRASPFSLKLLLPMGISTPSNTWFLGLLKSSTQRHLDQFSRFFAGLTTLTDRQNNRQTMLLGL